MTRRRVAVWAMGASAVVAGWWAFGREILPDEIWGKVERGDLVLTAEVTGTLKAVVSEAVGPPQVPDVWDFKIAMMAPEGKDVKLGTPVLGFDTSELERKLLEKRAEGESAEKRIEKKEKDSEVARNDNALQLAEATSRQRKAQLTLDVPAELVKSQDLQVSRLELEEATRQIDYLKSKIEAQSRADRVALEALRAQKEAADRRVQEIQDAVQSMTVKATRAGTVVYANNWRDEKKKVGDSVWRGERILEIPDLSAMRAEGQIDESDGGRIAIGQKVRFRLDAHPDVEFTGKVASIWSTVQRQSWRNPLKVMKLDIALDATDPRKMRPGMRFRGTVEIGRVPGVMLVPSDAVFPTEDGPVAYRKTALGFERRRLELGARSEQSVEVKAGLGSGDRVARRDLGMPSGEGR